MTVLAQGVAVRVETPYETFFGWLHTGLADGDAYQIIHLVDAADGRVVRTEGRAFPHDLPEPPKPESTRFGKYIVTKPNGWRLMYTDDFDAARRWCAATGNRVSLA